MLMVQYGYRITQGLYVRALNFTAYMRQDICRQMEKGCEKRAGCFDFLIYLYIPHLQLIMFGCGRSKWGIRDRVSSSSLTTPLIDTIPRINEATISKLCSHLKLIIQQLCHVHPPNDLYCLIDYDFRTMTLNITITILIVSIGIELIGICFDYNRCSRLC